MTTKRGYILLTDTGTVFTKLIKLYTKKPYNHASIAFDSDLSEVYSFGRKTINNPFIGGFVKEDVMSTLFIQAECAIYSFEVTEAQSEKMKHYIQEIEAEKEHYRYNFLGLFGFILNKPIKRKKAFFCSQFVASVLKVGNIIDFEKPVSLVAPNDLQKLSNLQLEYQGKLEDYPNTNVDTIARFSVQLHPISF
ncbi:MAG: hypothetical protein ACQEXB_10930 [Bacillota bacterium]